MKTVAEILSIIWYVIVSILIPWPSLAVPFAVDKEGTIVETNFHVSRSGSYGFYLDLSFKPGDPSDRAIVQKLSATGETFNGRQSEKAVAIPLHLTVARITDNTEEVILDYSAESEPVEGYSASWFEKIITTASLERGDYKIKIEALANIPELHDRPIVFLIHTTQRK